MNAGKSVALFQPKRSLNREPLLIGSEPLFSLTLAAAFACQVGEFFERMFEIAEWSLLISLPRDAVSVDLVFKEPRGSRVSAAASLAGFIFIGALAMPLPWRRKR